MRIEDLAVTPIPRDIEGCCLSSRARRFLRAVGRLQRARKDTTRRMYRAEAITRYLGLNGGDLGKLRNLGVRA